MRFVRLTIQYLARSLPYLLLFNLPAAIVLGFFTRPMSTLSFLPEFLRSAPTTFADMLWVVFSKGALQKIYPVALMLVFLPLGLCLSLALIEKHMRVGKRNLLNAFKQINTYILPVAAAMLILAVMMTVYSFIQSGMLTLLKGLIDGTGTMLAVNACLSMAIAAGLFVLTVFMVCPTLFLPPTMALYGYSLRDSFGSSFRLVSKNVGGVGLGLLLPTFSVALLENGILLLPVPSLVVSLLNTVLYLFMIVYFVSFIMVTFFDLSGLERRDNANKAYGGKRVV